eukprot:360248-Chlamydomonas_euryale.AAC.2
MAGEECPVLFCPSSRHRSWQEGDFPFFSVAAWKHSIRSCAAWHQGAHPKRGGGARKGKGGGGLAALHPPLPPTVVPPTPACSCREVQDDIAFGGPSRPQLRSAHARSACCVPRRRCVRAA